MRKTYSLLCQLEILIVCGFANKRPSKDLPSRKKICEELRSAGKRVFKEMSRFFSTYEPVLTQEQKRRGFASKLVHAWCAIFASLRKHYRIPKGSTTEFETLEEWVSWASRLKIS